MPTVVYIAAPYAANEGLSIEENEQRAVVLAELAAAQGYTPLFVHREVGMGLYGRDEVPEERERGLRSTRMLAQTVGYAQGELWMLRLPSGRWSTGCEGERIGFILGAQALAKSLFLVRARIVQFRWESGKPVRFTHEEVT